MTIVFEIGKPFIKKPTRWHTDISSGLGWLWFAVRYIRIPYPQLVMRAHDFVVDGVRYESYEALKNAIQSPTESH